MLVFRPHPQQRLMQPREEEGQGPARHERLVALVLSRIRIPVCEPCMRFLRAQLRRLTEELPCVSSMCLARIRLFTIYIHIIIMTTNRIFYYNICKHTDRIQHIISAGRSRTRRQMLLHGRKSKINHKLIPHTTLRDIPRNRHTCKNICSARMGLFMC